MDRIFDVVVVGGGHAGCEAAAAAARVGASVALITMRADRVGAMSCNPAIGGIGKGHIVREVDAFDGIIGRAADQAAIHYRMLNRSKGVAVQGPRIQADRVRYAGAVRAALAEYASIAVIEADVQTLVIDSETVAGVDTNVGRFACNSVILAAGTFLGGILHTGLSSKSGGRTGERAAEALGMQLRTLGLPIARLKTGTPPRLDGRTIDWARLKRQASDDLYWTMSPETDRGRLPQVHCAVTRTNREAHNVIREALDQSPLFSGRITGSGPRYCPSIEDKVFRFGDRDGHQIFLEPEGLDTVAVYPNGISTSLPVEAQSCFLRTINGLEQCVIMAPGYAVEYDHIDPRALDARLSVTGLTGLFMAGQINGTTGYEEAAGQGLVAGMNAARFALGFPPILFDRRDSYLGVMIDDLILQGVTEPYRMLTARADNRLHLRADNAETRLTTKAIAAGVVRTKRKDGFVRRELARNAIRTVLDRRMADRAGSHLIRQAFSATDPSAAVTKLVPELTDHDPVLVCEIIADRLYEPYVARQQMESQRVLGNANLRLDRVAFDRIAGLSSEMVERLQRARPANLDEASRVRGITPAALTAILVQARRAA